MSANSIGYRAQPFDYTKYSIMSFPNWKALEDFAYKVKEKMPNRIAEQANRNFKTYVENILNGQDNKEAYGLFGKHPKTYDEAMSRDKFIYYKEYDEIKKEVEKKVQENLAKSSEAEAMKPRLVFNDKEIGDFVFDKAAMSLQPEIYHYNPKSKKEVDVLTQKIIYKGDKMYLESDNSLVVFAFKVERSAALIKLLFSLALILILNR
jgi:BMFP domain-containing protein YqiC